MGLRREGSSDRTGGNRKGQAEEEPRVVVDVSVWEVARVEVVAMKEKVGFKWAEAWKPR